MPRAPQASLQARAADELRFIRATMERAGPFTAVPGWGGVIMGLTALATAGIAGPPRNDPHWLGVWLADAAVAATIAVVAIAHKARRAGSPIATAPIRRFALATLPPLAAGAILTAVFVQEGLARRLPSCWLLLYGAGLTTGGAMSVGIIPIMGVLFMGLGVAASAAPAEWGHLFMAVGFGGLHIVFGLVIARKYGG